MPAISRCEVDHTSSFPTHRPLKIEVNTEKIDVVANRLMRPTNYAELFEGKVKMEFTKREQDAAAKEPNEEKSTEENKVITEDEVRKELKHELHKLMDEQIEQRQHRLKHVEHSKDTTRIWQLIAAAVENANIAFHGLQGNEAKRMQGRSKITFRERGKDILQGLEEECCDDDLAARADWLRTIADEHAAQGNRLTNTARRMKANAGIRNDATKRNTNDCYNATTFKAYVENAKHHGRKQQLNDTQKKQIAEAWKNVAKRKAGAKRDIK